MVRPVVPTDTVSSGSSPPGPDPTPADILAINGLWISTHELPTKDDWDQTDFNMAMSGINYFLSQYPNGTSPDDANTFVIYQDLTGTTITTGEGSIIRLSISLKQLASDWASNPTTAWNEYENSTGTSKALKAVQLDVHLWWTKEGDPDGDGITSYPKNGGVKPPGGITAAAVTELANTITNWSNGTMPTDPDVINLNALAAAVAKNPSSTPYMYLLNNLLNTIQFTGTESSGKAITGTLKELAVADATLSSSDLAAIASTLNDLNNNENWSEGS